VALDYFDGLVNKQTSMIVDGIGALPGNLTITDGPTYDYGSHTVGTTTSKTFTVTNTGGVPATSITPSGLGAPIDFTGGTYPGTGGTCGTTLAGAGTCTIVVDYSPTTTGLHTATLTLNYHDGVTGQSSFRAIQGTGLQPAILALSELDPYDYGTFATGTTNDYTFTLTNSGGSVATGLNGTGLTAPFVYKGGSYPGTGGTCSTTLNVASSCTVVVQFNPTVVGVFNSTITINYHDGAAAQTATRNVTGTGANPALIGISDGPTYNFGTHAVGSATDHTFTLTNSGGVPATAMSGAIAAPFTYKGGAYPGAGGTCGATLAVAANCTIVVTYSPVALGADTSQIQISYHDGAAAQTSLRDVNGSGVAPASLAISDGPTYDFGQRAMGSSTEFVFTVTNTGGVAASSMTSTSLAAPFTFTGGAYPGVTGTCGATLAAGASCTVAVTYSPTALGAHSDSIDISYNDEVVVQTSSRAVAGTGVNPALLTIDRAPLYDYGVQATDSVTDVAFTVTNTGDVPATALAGSGLSVAYSFAGGTYPGTGGTCGTTLAAGANCSIVVRFNPASTGLHVATLTVSYMDGALAQTATRPIQGTGADKAFLTISDPPSYDFGTQPLTASVDYTFTITNTGGVPATGMASASLSAPFSYKGGVFPGVGGTCAATLANGASCTIVLNYAPTATGAHADTVVIDYNDGVVAQQVTRDIQGTGVNPASLAISDGPTYNYGLQAVGSSTDFTFTVTNTGGFMASGLNGLGLAPPFDFKGGAYPGTGGDCSITLAAGATCTIIVTYAQLHRSFQLQGRNLPGRRRKLYGDSRRRRSDLYDRRHLQPHRQRCHDGHHRSELQRRRQRSDGFACRSRNSC
jgi:hypothetical protein